MQGFELSEFLKSGGLWADRGGLWLGWGEKNAEPPSFVRREGVSFYQPGFFLDQSHSWCHYPFARSLSRLELIELLNQAPLEAVQRPDPLVWGPADFQGFSALFRSVQDLIFQRKLKKGVPYTTQKSQVHLTPAHRGWLLLELLKKTLEMPVILYGQWDAAGGVLGATPEMLLEEVEEGVLKIPALAGTRWKGSGLMPLLSDPKQREEHQLVIDGIVQSIQNSPFFLQGEIQVGPTVEMDAGMLSHLYAPVFLYQRRPQRTGEDQKALFLELIQSLHPTPAVGAFPKASGQDWLLSSQKEFDRYDLGAPFGVFDPTQKFRCAVGIRNLKWKPRELILAVGCGVVARSDIEQEWREAQAKMDSVKNLFGILEGKPHGSEF